MKKIILAYDGSAIYDEKGTYIATYTFLEEPREPNVDIRDILKLKEAGFDAKEIIELWKNGVLVS